MVCIACLLPLFLIPVVNALPLLFDLIVGKIYRLFGWEYRKPARVPAACPYKPASKNVDGLNAVCYMWSNYINECSFWLLPVPMLIHIFFQVSCSDNHIHLLKMPTMDISKSISGIKPPFSFPLKHEGSCTQVAFEQTTGLVAVSTEDYCVQFYSLFDNHEVSEVQVCKRNFQPADDVMLYVALVAISLDGSLMATIDVTIPEEKLGGLVCLKYWTRGSLVAEYLLSTVIYEPHSDAQVSSLAFRPGHNMAVTSSYGGDFKVWVHGSHADRNNESIQRTGWRCQSVGSYKGKSLTAAAFSADGSVLAIAAETIITLWDPDSNILVAMIGDTLSPITKPSFVGESEYLVSYTHGLKPQLSVWSTSNLALYWSHGIVTEAVSCSHDESQFAVLALLSSAGDADAKGNGVIFFFDVEDPVPVAT
ncbi:WD repeat-containing protein 75-like [Zingiber officinale]|nr:WD repeat-containing protein 75-like [Zingiber officinale]